MPTSSSLPETVKVIFLYSSSPDDQLSIKKLYEHLYSFRKLPSVKVIWHCVKEQTGEENESDIFQEATRAKLIVPLLSVSFLNRHRHWHPLVTNKKKGTVVPVIVKECLWKEDDVIKRLGCLPKNGESLEKNAGLELDKDYAYVSVAKSLLGKVNSIKYEQLFFQLLQDGQIEACEEAFEGLRQQRVGEIIKWRTELGIEDEEADDIERRAFDSWKQKPKRRRREELQPRTHSQTPLAPVFLLFLVIVSFAFFTTSLQRSNNEYREIAYTLTNYRRYIINSQYEDAWRELLSDEYRQRDFEGDYSKYEERWRKLDKFDDYYEFTLLEKNYRGGTAQVLVKWQYCVKGYDNFIYREDYLWLRKRKVWVIDRIKEGEPTYRNKRCSEG